MRTSGSRAWILISGLAICLLVRAWPGQAQEAQTGPRGGAEERIAALEAKLRLLEERLEVLEAKEEAANTGQLVASNGAV